MNLSNLKSAWSQLKCQYSLQGIDQAEVLQLIEAAEYVPELYARRILINAGAFILLLICCQGG